MKILYLSFNDPHDSPGVYNKELEFCRAMHAAFKKQGVVFSGLNIIPGAKPGSLPDPKDSCLNLKPVPSRLYQRFSGIKFFRSLFLIRPVFRATYQAIAEITPDILLWRFNTTRVPGIFNPKKVRPNLLFVTEHQAKEIEELSMSGPGRLLAPLIRTQSYLVLRNVDALVGVTREIAAYEQGRRGGNLPVHVHPNGINVSQCTPARYTPYTGEVLKLVFLGSSTARWHGLDRLVRGLAQYRGPVRIELHLVGDVTSEIRELIASLGLREQLIFHGTCSGEKLDQIFDQAHIAVGTLGMHRKKLKYGATLKIREYMARGVPFILSYIDEDITDDFSFCLRLPPDESPVDPEALIRFRAGIEERYGDTIPGRMRAYALEHMDYAPKVNKLLDFLLSLPGKTNRGSIA